MPPTASGPGGLWAAGWALWRPYILLHSVYICIRRMYMCTNAGRGRDIKAALMGRCHTSWRAAGDARGVWGQLLSQVCPLPTPAGMPFPAAHCWQCRLEVLAPPGTLVPHPRVWLSQARP